MNIIGIGTDLVDIRRIEKILSKSTRGEKFAQRILHSNELIKFKDHKQAASYLAKRFATKEAVSKALGTGIGSSVHFGDIETYHNELGAPMLRLHGKTKEYAEQRGVEVTFVSLSDERYYALSYVILVGAD
ncbi:MAG: holo-ACP synthase [Thiotrichaceae bacterium]|nr:holo-ACP synthase [Thiotrichaceae bacterium]